MTLNSRLRFWATVAAQVAGILLLFFIGIIFEVFADPTDHMRRMAVASGMHAIFIIAFLVLLGLVFGVYLSFNLAKKCGGVEHFYDDPCVDKMLGAFLVIDIPLLTILVCLQGGLTKSIFFPLFFLIPVAHYAVEQRGKRHRVLWGVEAIAVCMIISYAVSYFMASFKMQSLFGLSFLRITDFSALAPERYALAVLIVSLISLFIPVLQMRIIRFSPKKDKSVKA
jgi:hypothetical protein